MLNETQKLKYIDSKLLPSILEMIKGLDFIKKFVL